MEMSRTDIYVLSLFRYIFSFFSVCCCCHYLLCVERAPRTIFPSISTVFIELSWWKISIKQRLNHFHRKTTQFLPIPWREFVEKETDASTTSNSHCVASVFFLFVSSCVLRMRFVVCTTENSIFNFSATFSINSIRRPPIFIIFYAVYCNRHDRTGIPTANRKKKYVTQILGALFFLFRLNLVVQLFLAS